jgi:DNA repair exonuclease SbcCD ATPase subunit
MARILSLTLTNFQGVTSQRIDFAGVNTTIYGRNATGKSTIANAMTWLLYDKAADGGKNYSPKTHGSDGHIHNLNHSAEMEIELDGGLVLTLKRVYHEVYHKKRGTNTEEFDGNVTDHYIDGVPVLEKEYKARVMEICPPDTAKVLTQPWYFAESMSKDERRCILLEVCGDITDDDVIRATPEIADLPEILKKPGSSQDLYTVDEFRRIAAARKADINRELGAIPSRIDEATRAIPEVVFDPNINEKITGKRGRMEEENKKLAEIKAPASNDEADATVRAQIANIEARIAEGRAKHSEQAAAAQVGPNAQKNEILDRVNALRLEATGYRHELDDRRRVLEGMKRDLDHTNRRRAELLKEHANVSAQQWDANNEVCPTCKQTLPETDVEAMRNDFNAKKSERLEALQVEGSKVSKAVIADKEAAIANVEKYIAELEKAATEAESNIVEARKELDSVKTPVIPAYEATEDYKSKAAELSRAQQERANLRYKVQTGASEAIKAQEAVIGKLSNELTALLEVKANIEQVERLRARIEELSAQEKKLAGDYERTERGLYLCELFVRAKVSMLTNAINSKFTRVRFRLFKDHITGGLTDDCEVLVPGQGDAFVPWGEGANTGAKMNAGLEIIGVLSKHWKTSLPIICDNAECVSEWTKIDAQVIKLVVTTTDDKLRVEYE